MQDTPVPAEKNPARRVEEYLANALQILLEAGVERPLRYLQDVLRVVVFSGCEHVTRLNQLTVDDNPRRPPPYSNVATGMKAYGRDECSNVLEFTPHHFPAGLSEIADKEDDRALLVVRYRTDPPTR